MGWLVWTFPMLKTHQCGIEKAFKLLVTVWQLNDEGTIEHYECQVNLIREGSLNNFSVRPVTAKHNIVMALNEAINVEEKFWMAILRVPKTGMQKDIELDFPDGECE